jgi:hypothetical protein
VLRNLFAYLQITEYNILWGLPVFMFRRSFCFPCLLSTHNLSLERGLDYFNFFLSPHDLGTSRLHNSPGQENKTLLIWELRNLMRFGNWMCFRPQVGKNPVSKSLCSIWDTKTIIPICWTQLSRYFPNLSLENGDRSNVRNMFNWVSSL